MAFQGQFNRWAPRKNVGTRRQAQPVTLHPYHASMLAQAARVPRLANITGVSAAIKGSTARAKTKR